MRRAVGAFLDRTPLGQPMRGFRRRVVRRLDSFVSVEPVRVWVRPQDIELVTTERYDKYLGLRVRGGDWDLAVRRFDDLDVHRAIEGRVRHGVEWQETEFYGRVVAQMAAGTVKWGCTTPAEFDARCVYLDELIHDIATNGFWDANEESGAPVVDRDGITLYVGRQGELIFQDGRHRLAIAKVLGVASLPAIVVRRHRDWEDLRAALHRHATAPPGTLPAVLHHPDLADVAQLDDDGEFDELAGLIGSEPGRVLDLNSRGGHLAHQLSARGFRCTVLEADAVAALLSGVSTARFDTARGPDAIGDEAFDAVVCSLDPDDVGIDLLDRIASPAMPRSPVVVLRVSRVEGGSVADAARRLERAAAQLQAKGWRVRDGVDGGSGGASVVTLERW